jgi:intraflagellar transport protein 172
MWQDALRVCKEYVPQKLEALQDEYEAAVSKNSRKGAESLVGQAREWEGSGEYTRAVECYLKVTDEVTTDANLLFKCWMKVQDLFLFCYFTD